MNDKKIEKEDLQRLKDFQDTILNLKEEGAPKYEIDFEMESQIKYDALIDHFGVKSVSEALQTLEISKEDLSDNPTYLDIYGYLEARNKNKD
jgi:hypothetical protein